MGMRALLAVGDDEEAKPSNFNREPDMWSLGNPIVMAFFVIVCSAGVAIAFFYCVMPCARYVNGVWPEDWTMASSSRQVHPESHHGPKLRRDVGDDDCLEAMKRMVGLDDKPHPATLLNNRPITALEALKMASGTANGRLGSAQVRHAKDETPGGDRLALMSFFADTVRENHRLTLMSFITDTVREYVYRWAPSARVCVLRLLARQGDFMGTKRTCELQCAHRSVPFPCGPLLLRRKRTATGRTPLVEGGKAGWTTTSRSPTGKASP
jgi:hypothetical protein